MSEAKDRDWTFLLKKHRLGKEKEAKNPRSFSESKKRFKQSARSAKIPKEFWYDKEWVRLEPEPITVSEPVKGKHPFRISIRAQKNWIRRLLKRKEYHKRGCIILFGDYMSEAAERVAFGILTYAVRHGASVRAFHPIDLAKGPPKDVDGSELQYDIVFLNRIHTDDEGPRRNLVRDFVNKHYEKSFKIILIYGDNPIEFFYKKIGLNPQAIFCYPYEGQLIKTDPKTYHH